MGDFLSSLSFVLGKAGLLTDNADIALYPTDWRGEWHGRAQAIARPSTTGAAVLEGQRLCDPQIKHDVAVPISRPAVFITLARAALIADQPGLVINPFGHAGDGNVHFNISTKPSLDRARITQIVYDHVRRHQGSLAAEHGVGRLKGKLFRDSLIFGLKRHLDPDGLFNPHILPLPSAEAL